MASCEALAAEPHSLSVVDSAERDSDRMASLDDLSRLSQDFGGYDEIPGDD